MFQLKHFVEALIEFHLGSKYNLKNIAEAAADLDLPCDKNELNKSKRTHGTASALLSGT